MKRILLDEHGNLVVEYSYDAWGAPLGTTGTLAATLGAANPFRYRSYYWDSEIGLYYLQSRYYSPEWGRFVNADFQIDVGAGLIAPNLFAYCLNNPVNHSDPTGESITIVLFGIPFLLTEVVAMVGAMLFVTAYFTSPKFRNAVDQAIVWAFNEGIRATSSIVKRFTIITFGVASAIVTSISIVKADAKIKRTVKKSSKTRYWSATIKAEYVDLGRPLTYTQAVYEVAAGRNVFAVMWYEASAVARAAGGTSGANNKPLHAEIDKKNSLGYYWHYHTYNRKGGHVFYLFGP